MKIEPRRREITILSVTDDTEDTEFLTSFSEMSHGTVELNNTVVISNDTYPNMEELTHELVEYWHPHLDLVERENGQNYATPWSRATVAYVILDNQIEFAISFCSPKDMFDKRTGREAALERLLDYDTSVCIGTRKRLTAREAREVIAGTINVGHLVDLPFYPVRFNSRKNLHVEVCPNCL